MKRKVDLILIMLLTMSLLVGCAKVIKTESKEVVATVECVDFTPMWVQPIFCGKTMTMVTHPETYDVRLKYDGNDYYMHNESDYKYCKDKKEIKCILSINYYDDNNISNDITEIIKE